MIDMTLLLSIRVGDARTLAPRTTQQLAGSSDGQIDDVVVRARTDIQTHKTTTVTIAAHARRDLITLRMHVRAIERSVCGSYPYLVPSC